jgi:hypothetical protein
VVGIVLAPLDGVRGNYRPKECKPGLLARERVLLRQRFCKDGCNKLKGEALPEGLGRNVEGCVSEDVFLDKTKRQDGQGSTNFLEISYPPR